MSHLIGQMYGSYEINVSLGQKRLVRQPTQLVNNPGERAASE